LLVFCSARISSMEIVERSNQQDPAIHRTGRVLFITLPSGNALKCSRWPAFPVNTSI
jgi:hypothetical protein